MFMKSVRINIKLLFCLVLLPIFAWVGCSDDLGRKSGSKQNLGKEHIISFSVQIPTATSAQEQLLSHESDISEVILLLFDKDEKYVYQPISSHTLYTDASNSSIKTFEAKIPEGSYSSVVLLANAEASFIKATSDQDNPIKPGISKADLLSKLEVIQALGWSVDSSADNYKPMPMWGEVSSVVVNSSLTDGISLTLVRMLARIDVISRIKQTNLNLKEVYLYNSNDRGVIAPTIDNWEVEPSVPYGVQKLEDPLFFDQMTTSDDIVSCLNQIYTFEALKGSSTDYLNNTCLVVGGHYKDDTKVSYYRIDFGIKVEDTLNYLDLLRNHRYDIDIKSVSGPGLPTPEEAFKSRRVDITADVLAWTDSEVSDIVDDGQNKFGVSKAQFTLNREAKTATSKDNVLTITTDYSLGWNVSKTVDTAGADITNGWLKLDKTLGAAGTTNTQLLLTENNTGATRTGKLHLTAGRLTMVVTVVQEGQPPLSLSIVDADDRELKELVFPSGLGLYPSQKSFRISWQPADQSVAVKRTAVNGYSNVLYAGKSPDTPGYKDQDSYSSPSGTKELKIIPNMINDNVTDIFKERRSKLDFTISNGAESLTKTITVRQYVRAMLSRDVEGFYRTDGSAYSFNLLSSVPWKIVSIEGKGMANLSVKPSENLKVGTTSGPSTTVGTKLSFSVASNPRSSGDVTVTFESTDAESKLSYSVTFNLGNSFKPTSNSGWASSNIYWDEEMGSLTFDDDPESDSKYYQGLYFRFGSLSGATSSASDGDIAWDGYVYAPSNDKYVRQKPSRGWTSIPYIASSVEVSDQSRAYLYEVTDAEKGVGDICRHLTLIGVTPGSHQGVKWRMPTANEMKDFVDKNSFTDQIKKNAYATNSGAGINLVNTGLDFSYKSGVYFPFSGYRGATDGQLASAFNKQGYYWSSSLGTGLSTTEFYSHHLLLHATNRNRINVAYRESGMSIRCVKE